MKTGTTVGEAGVALRVGDANEFTAAQWPANPK